MQRHGGIYSFSAVSLHLYIPNRSDGIIRSIQAPTYNKLYMYVALILLYNKV